MPPGDLAYIDAMPGLRVVDVVDPCVVVVDGELSRATEAMRVLEHWSVKPAKGTPWRRKRQ